MPDPYLASNDFPGDGVTTLRTISFKGNRPDAVSGTVPYLSAGDVKASKITPATPTTPETEVALTVAYVGPNQFNITPACPVGTICRVYRATQDEYNLVDYQALQNVSESDLDLANRQTIFITQEAHDLAQRAKADIAQATTVAYEAMATASDAEDTADGAVATANAANAAAQNAVVVATAADATADAAAADAANAVSTANGIAGTANTALTNANAAVATANNALSVANGIAGTAESAVTIANGAVSTANTANTTANAAQATATAAEATANAIAGTANTALSNSSTALSTANTALATANSFESRVSALETSQTTQNGQISTLQSDVSTHTSQISNLTANKQPLDATLTGLAALTISANQVPLGSGTDTFTTIASGATGRTMLAAANEAAVLAALPNVYHRGNIRGSVSQSGGTPTGAIIERGSNGNGEYVRYADGTQFCWNNFNLGTVGVTGSAGNIWFISLAPLNFPAAFVAGPSITTNLTVVSSGGLVWTSQGSNFPTTNATQGWFALAGTPTTSPMSGSYTAWGRWF